MTYSSLSIPANIFMSELAQQTHQFLPHYMLGTMLATGDIIMNTREYGSQGSYIPK